jgi:hypothetical protein
MFFITNIQKVKFSSQIFKMSSFSSQIFKRSCFSSRIFKKSSFSSQILPLISKWGKCNQVRNVGA